jgi:methylphosphotriester-DNA--protein-cysteine methyltransferase
VKHRVFFANEETAVAAGYRPCAVCLRERYAAWKAASGQAENAE